MDILRYLILLSRYNFAIQAPRIQEGQKKIAVNETHIMPCLDRKTPIPLTTIERIKSLKKLNFKRARNANG